MNIKSRRLEELIKVKLSQLLLRGLKDPRLGAFITLLDVKLSGDTRYAKIYVSIIGTRREKINAMNALKNASGYIQMRLGKEIRIRRIPKLEFLLDEETEKRVRLVHKIEELSEKYGNSNHNPENGV